MREIVLQIPTLDAEQNVDIEVKINGRRRCLRYRVEIIDWAEKETEAEEKVDVLRRVIHEHEKDWQLVQIGMPTEKHIPVMFRKRSED